MKRLSNFIVKNRVAILIIVSILMLISGVAFFFVRINSDMISYLPSHKPTKQGIQFLVDNFGMQGDATLGINGMQESDVEKLVNEISQVKGVRKESGVMWYGSISSLGNNDIMQALSGDITANEEIMSIFHPKIDDKDQCYVLMLFLDVPSSSNEATKALNEIDSIVQEYKKTNTSLEYHFGGSSALTRDIFNSVFGEIWKFLIIGLLIIFLILLLTTTSVIEPIILLLTLGVSIILNMGTNIIFGEISTVTLAVSALLQLGLSMDYAIFLIHAYYAEKKFCLDDLEAMRRAIGKTFSTVFSSALTTVFGFIALFFMQFTMGADIGRVLAKGVFLSMVTVIILQPCLILIFRKPLKKYSHRILVPRFNKVGSFSVKNNKKLFILMLLFILPTMIMQSKVKYSYMEMGLSNPNPTKLQQTVNTIGNSIITIVPVKNGIENLETQREFAKEIKQIKNVSHIMGLYSMLPEGNIVLDGFVSRNLTTSEIFSQMVQPDINTGIHYTIYSIMMSDKVASESKEAEEVLRQIQELTDKYFGEEAKKNNLATYYEYEGKPAKVYVTGTAQSVKDLAEITPQDFKIVSLVSILAILIILIFTLKSFKISVLLIAIIELGIFMNLAISYLTKVPINFMAYIIISAVQLGATVDYAILYTVTYQRKKQEMGVKRAGYEATVETGMSITTSASIIAGACLSVSMVAKNLIIKQLTELIGRGAIISAVLVILLLPAILVTFAKEVQEPVRFANKFKIGLLKQIKQHHDKWRDKKVARYQAIEDQEKYEYLSDKYDE